VGPTLVWATVWLSLSRIKISRGIADLPIIIGIAQIWVYEELQTCDGLRNLGRLEEVLVCDLCF
jgi:hypothetical protein